MGTAKRERQKANRQLRLEELAKQARQQKSKRVGVRVAIVLAVVVAIVAAVNLLGDDDEAVTPATTMESTVTPTTSPDKPQVSLPAELPTELVVTELIAGTGPESVVGDTLTVNYVGVLSADGTEFDNSYDRGQPFSLTLGAGGVIAGWDQGLVGVQAGGRYQLDIPADLAYGDSGSGSVIKPGDAITFVIDVLSITPGTPTGSTAPATSAAPTTT